MAEFLTQNEIESMLSQVNDNEEIKEIADAKDEVIDGFTLENCKVHRKPQRKIIKYAYKYQSPVVKSEDVVFNPPKNALMNTTKIPVYSLTPYKIA
ncbi:hypothetical protein ACFL67_04230 [candidate division KSB1 bacterium]